MKTLLLFLSLTALLGACQQKPDPTIDPGPEKPVVIETPRQDCRQRR